jgi:Kef-type K+ transport system membrane component KefB
MHSLQAVLKFLVRLAVIAVLAVFVLKMYRQDPTMALVLGGIGLAAIIMWITEG